MTIKTLLTLVAGKCILMSLFACQTPISQSAHSAIHTSQTTNKSARDQFRGSLRADALTPQDLKGTEIRLDNHSARTRSDQQGNFSLAGMEGQTPQYLTAHKVLPNGSTLSARQALADVRQNLGSLLLKASGAIVGKVSLSGGRDLTGINVFLAGTSMGALTDAEGNYFLSDVPEGTYTITAIKAGFAPVQQSVSVPSGKPLQVTLALNTPLSVDSDLFATLSGQIRDLQGPVSDAVVRLNGASQAAVTDQNGHYELLQIEPGENITLQVQRRGYVFLEQQISLKAGESVKDLQLQKDPETPPGKLTGTLTDDDGHPLSEATIETRPLTKTVITDKSGRFEIPDVLPGSYYLTGKQNGQLKASRFIGIDGGQTIDVPLKGMVITGDNAKVCDQQNINNININIPGAQVTVTVNNQNTCTIDGKPAQN